MRKGFTLSELLLALAILGVIAVFTIPKVLQSQQDGKYKAIAKEAAATISGAFQAYELNNTVTADTQASDLTPFMNYVSIQTTGSIDNALYGAAHGGERVCHSAEPCISFHNGSKLLYTTGSKFGGLGTTHAIWFVLDPDGQYSNSTRPDQAALVFFLYPNKRITSGSSVLTGTFANTLGPYDPSNHPDPPWFSWN